jgi:hypothetical protein
MEKGDLLGLKPKADSSGASFDKIRILLVSFMQH